MIPDQPTLEDGYRRFLATVTHPRLGPYLRETVRRAYLSGASEALLLVRERIAEEERIADRLLDECREHATGPLIRRF